MNKYELKKNESGFYESTMVCDGVTSWELYPSFHTEISILEKLRDKNYFQKYNGPWIISLPDDYRTFRDDKLNNVISMAITYIHERDLTYWEDHF